MISSHFTDYVSETLGLHTLEFDHGFIMFDYLDDETVYVREIFVEKSKRGTDYWRKMADAVCELAVSRGNTKLIAGVLFSLKTIDRSIKIMHSYGMKFLKVDSSGLYFVKELT